MHIYQFITFTVTDIYIKYKNIHTHTHTFWQVRRKRIVAALAPQSHTDLYTYKLPCKTYLQYLQS